MNSAFAGTPGDIDDLQEGKDQVPEIQLGPWMVHGTGHAGARLGRALLLKLVIFIGTLRGVGGRGVGDYTSLIGLIRSLLGPYYGH